MIKVSKKINLSQLDKELNGLGLNALKDENGVITFVGLTENNPASEKDLEEAIKNHKAQDEPQMTIEEKLQFVGLSIEELKAALGL